MAAMHLALCLNASQICLLSGHSVVLLRGPQDLSPIVISLPIHVIDIHCCHFCSSQPMQAVTSPAQLLPMMTSHHLDQSLCEAPVKTLQSMGMYDALCMFGRRHGCHEGPRA